MQLQVPQAARACAQQRQSPASLGFRSAGAASCSRAIGRAGRDAPRGVALRASGDGGAAAGAATETEVEALTGEELRELVVNKGKPFDTRIMKRREPLKNTMRFYLQVMWRHVGQRSCPLTEEQYAEQLQAVAELVTEWGCADEVRSGIKNCAKRPVLDTVGAKAVMIPLSAETPA